MIADKMYRYQNGVWYTFNVCPADHMQGFGRKDRVFTVCQNMVKNVFYYYNFSKTVNNFKLYPDVSFPEDLSHKTCPRVHFHGRIKFLNIHAFLMIRPPEGYRITIKKIDDSKEWKLYETKYIDYVDLPEMFKNNVWSMSKYKSIPDCAKMESNAKYGIG